MSLAEANTLIGIGRNWLSGVWIGGDANMRNALIAQFNNALAGNFILNRGWQNYDPVVRKAGSRAETYLHITRRLAGRSVASANEFIAWATGNLAFANLNEDLQILALITHVCEVGRGYQSSLASQLYPFVRDISNGHARWEDIKDRYPPSLTYGEDKDLDWQP